MDIPRAGPSNNLWDGLGQKKNILEGVADEDYPWLRLSSLEDSDEEVISTPKGGTEDTMLEKKLSLVVSKEANLEEAVAMYMKPFIAMELMEVLHPKQDKVMQHV